MRQNTKSKQLFLVTVTALLLYVTVNSTSLTVYADDVQTEPAVESSVTLEADKSTTGITLKLQLENMNMDTVDSISIYENDATTDNTDSYLAEFYGSENSYNYNINIEDIRFGSDLRYYAVVETYEYRYDDEGEDKEIRNTYTSEYVTVSQYTLSAPTITCLKNSGEAVIVKFGSVVNTDGYMVNIYKKGKSEALVSSYIDADDYTSVMNAGGVKFGYESYDLSRGVAYDVRVDACKGYYSYYYNNVYYSKTGARKSIVIPLTKVTGVKASNNSESSNQITWSKDSNVSGYRIAYATSKDGAYKTLQTVSKNTLKYTHTGLKLGQTYYYRVYGYTTATTAPASSTVSARILLKKVGSIKTAMQSASKMKVTWIKNTKASGYYVYRAVSTDEWDISEYKYYKKVKKSSNPSITVSVSNGKHYSYKIIPYITISGENVKGNEAIKARYADYYAYENEDYSSKWKRIYGSSQSQYTSSSQASKNMTTIAVKVWDFRSGMSGTKVTKTKYITINKKIANTVKKIFAEIYNGKEKAPIYSAGGYSWRTGQHGQGLAIDLNPDYNYFINRETNKILSGSYWNPKKYAYSIKQNGDIENAFKKYGFGRGIWSTTSDYMHFSYFGV